MSKSSPKMIYRLLVTLLALCLPVTPAVAQTKQIIQIRSLKSAYPKIDTISTRITIRMRGPVNAKSKNKDVDGYVAATYVIDNLNNQKALEFGGPLLVQLMGLGADLPTNFQFKGIGMYLMSHDLTYVTLQTVAPTCLKSSPLLVAQIGLLDNMFTPEALIGDWVAVVDKQPIEATFLGTEKVNGVLTRRYRVERDVLLALSEDSLENRKSYEYAEIWLASSGDHMVRAVIYGKGRVQGVEVGVRSAFNGDYQISYDVLGVNNGQHVTVPSFCKVLK